MPVHAGPGLARVPGQGGDGAAGRARPGAGRHRRGSRAGPSPGWPRRCCQCWTQTRVRRRAPFIHERRRPDCHAGSCARVASPAVPQLPHGRFRGIDPPAGGRKATRPARGHPARHARVPRLPAGSECRIGTVRDALRWHLIETAPGRYDWSSILPMVRQCARPACNRFGICAATAIAHDPRRHTPRSSGGVGPRRCGPPGSAVRGVRHGRGTAASRTGRRHGLPRPGRGELLSGQSAFPRRSDGADGALASPAVARPAEGRPRALRPALCLSPKPGRKAATARAGCATSWARSARTWKQAFR